MIASGDTGLWALRNGRIATMEPGAGLIPTGTIVAENGVILAVGADEAILAGLDCRRVIDLDGRLVTPGLIDCHTHLVHGGNRAAEFEMRLAGASYEEIARAGGGILSTVTATRAADTATLTASALARLRAMQAEGMTTIEIKSGYGLDLETEARMLRVARALGDQAQVSVATSYLAAHAVAPEFAGDADAFLDRVCGDWLPAITAEGLADAVDAFCERIAFTREQVRRLFQAARAHGLPVKLHADQLSNGHGASLAAEFEALSADHVEYTDPAGAAAMAAAGTVAVLLPGAFYFLREQQKPPIQIFRECGVRMAIGTDCNPGTSPLTSPLLAMNLAATQFRMTIEECLAGVTREAARALGIEASHGTIAPGKICDLAIWDVERPAELVYRMGFPSLYARVWHGHWQKVTAA